MLLPVLAYGSPILHKKCLDIQSDYPDIDILIENMWETMYAASGVGLAAPQIGKSIRIFIIDTNPLVEEDNDTHPIKRVFINPTILDESGEKWLFNEGCLSIPDIREDILRYSDIKIKYQDHKFEWHIDKFDGVTARVIQHEYDHIEGIIFTDRISPLRKRMIKRRLHNISKGEIDVSYNMRFHR